MQKSCKLSDGTEALIRSARIEDAPRELAFFSDLPFEDRVFLRRDVSRQEVVELRLREMRTGRVIRLVALVDNEVVADGSLELEAAGWKEDAAEIRIIVSRQYQRKRLGTLLARELYLIAAENKVKTVVARMMRPQAGARSIFRNLGFKDEFIMPEQICDLQGKWHDLIVMRCSLEDLWNRMETICGESDWQRHR